MELGDSFLAVGNYGIAKTYFESVLKYEPDNPDVLLKLAYIYCAGDSDLQDISNAEYYLNRLPKYGISIESLFYL